MSYQVGVACYATIVDAGSAACAAYAPVSMLVQGGAAVRTVSCTSADPITGALNLQISTSPVDGSGITSALISHPIAFPECIQGDYFAAGEVIFSAVLAGWALIWGVNAVRSYLDWSRGEST